jgi:hypothetical protein
MSGPSLINRGSRNWPPCLAVEGAPGDPTSLDMAVLRWTLGSLRARPWTVLDPLAMLCKQGGRGFEAP